VTPYPVRMRAGNWETGSSRWRSGIGPSRYEKTAGLWGQCFTSSRDSHSGVIHLYIHNGTCRSLQSMATIVVVENVKSQ
jgi:hypothetical protein